MQPAALIRLRPKGPWRFGAGASTGQQPDSHFRSDRLFSALTQAMERLGYLSEWLPNTALAKSPAISFSSLFPFQGDVHFVLPPANLWPPPAASVTSPNPVFLSKMRWTAARFVPVSLVETMLLGQKVLAEQWIVDGESGCLLRRDRPSASPFRMVFRRSAAVDRPSKISQGADSFACVEFEPDSGLWTVVRFRDEEVERTWRPRLQAAFRLLCDSGFGGRKRSGWGQAESPEISTGTWPNILLPRVSRALTKGSLRTAEADGVAQSYWLLSLLVPGSGDVIDWQSGSYSLQMRGGHVDSPTGLAGIKKQLRMIAEGSVVVAQAEPVGKATDVAPDGFAHPVYRSGIALSVAIPVFDTETTAESAVETDGADGEPATLEEDRLAPSKKVEGSQDVPPDTATPPPPDEAEETAEGASEDLASDVTTASHDELTHWSDPDSGLQTSDEIRAPEESPFIPSESIEEPDATSDAEVTPQEVNAPNNSEGEGEPTNEDSSAAPHQDEAKAAQDDDEDLSEENTREL